MESGGGGRGTFSLPSPVSTTADPFPPVDGETKSTKVKLATDSPIFDESHTFNLPNMTADKLGRVPIDIKLVDTHESIGGRLGGGLTIGDFATDIETVYFNNTKHELYRQWLALEAGGEFRVGHEALL